MEIVWFGHSCFRLRDREVSVVTDPFDASAGHSLPKLTADIVTVSCQHPHHNNTQSIQGDVRLIDSPGEYEIRGVFITGIATSPPSRQADPTPQRNTVFVLEFGSLTLCHLGALTHNLPQEQMQALNTVDVLMVPVSGGERSLNATRAAEIVSVVEPKLVIPMGYQTGDQPMHLDGVERFLKEMGVGRVETLDVLKVSENSLPQETQVVVLRPQRG